MPGDINIIQKRSKFAEGLEGIASMAGHIMPEIIQYKKDKEENEQFIAHGKDATRMLLDEIRGNGQVAQQLVDAGAINDVKELDVFVDKYNAKADTITDKDEFAEFTNDTFTELTMLGGGALPQNWLASVAANMGNKRAGEQFNANRNNTLRTKKRDNDEAKFREIEKYSKEEGANQADLTNKIRGAELGKEFDDGIGLLNNKFDTERKRTEENEKIDKRKGDSQQILDDFKNPAFADMTPEQARLYYMKEGYSEKEAENAYKVFSERTAQKEAERLIEADNSKQDAELEAKKTIKKEKEKEKEDRALIKAGNAKDRALLNETKVLETLQENHDEKKIEYEDKTKNRAEKETLKHELKRISNAISFQAAVVDSTKNIELGGQEVPQTFQVEGRERASRGNPQLMADIASLSSMEFNDPIMAGDGISGDTKGDIEAMGWEHEYDKTRGKHMLTSPQGDERSVDEWKDIQEGRQQLQEGDTTKSGAENSEAGLKAFLDKKGK
jgi:hypothetical protein